MRSNTQSIKPYETEYISRVRISNAVVRYYVVNTSKFLLPLFIQWHDSKLRLLLNFYTGEHIIIFFNAFFSVAFYWKILGYMNFSTFCHLYFRSLFVQRFPSSNFWCSCNWCCYSCQWVAAKFMCRHHIQSASMETFNFSIYV